MYGRALRAVTGLMIIGLLAGMLVVPAGASVRAGQVQGVTDDTIQIAVIVPDLDALAARGLASGQTTQSFVDRFKAHADTFGKINGRNVELITVGWDPIDTTSFDKACTKAVIDNKPFVVINGSGYRDSSIPCITVDNNTPYMTADPVGLDTFKASGKNLATLGLPPEIAAKEGVRMLDRTGELPKSAKIAILNNNIPGPKLAGDTLEKELEKRGYNVVSKVDLNGLASDAGLLRTEAATAANTFQQAGADTVFNVMAFTGMSSFFDEAARLNYKPKMYAVDGQANTCTIGAMQRMSASAENVTCITAWDGKAAADGGIRSDNPLEAKCRAEFEGIKGFTTAPNMWSGGATVNGVKYNEDFSPWECVLAEVLLPAMKKAGKNPTWPKVYKAMMAQSDGRAAYMSDGSGGFTANKPYYVNNVHLMTLTRADANTPKAADGTYNGCPGPYACWVPEAVDGKEWYPISTSSQG